RGVPRAQSTVKLASRNPHQKERTSAATRSIGAYSLSRLSLNRPTQQRIARRAAARKRLRRYVGFVDTALMAAAVDFRDFQVRGSLDGHDEPQLTRKLAEKRARFGIGNRAYAQPPRLDAGVDSAGFRCECIGQFACASQPSNWSRRRVPAHRIAPHAAARQRTIAAKNGVARTMPNQGRLTAGRRTFGIATLVQPRFTTCSSQASFAIFARPYAISSPRYTVTKTTSLGLCARRRAGIVASAATTRRNPSMP